MESHQEDSTLQELDDLLEKVDHHIDSVVEGTLISIVLDRSGSMSGVAQQTIDGFNKLIEDQKAEPGKAWVSLTLFDTSVRVVFTGLPIDQVQPLTGADYRPDGGTALLDAQGITIEATEKYLASVPEAERPSQILFVTMTDGGENSSRDYTTEKLKKLIDAKQEADQWDFVYTGANQDSFAVAASMGYSPAMTVNYAGDAAGTAVAMAAVSSSVSQYRGMTDTARKTLRSKKDKSAFWNAPAEEPKNK